MDFNVLFIGDLGYHLEDINNKIIFKDRLDHSINTKEVDLLFISSALYKKDTVNSFLEHKVPIVYLLNNDNEYIELINSGLTDFISAPFSEVKITNKISHYRKIKNNTLLLQEEEEFSEAILDMTSNPVFLTDSKSIIHTNSVFNSLFNLSNIDEANLKFKKLSDIFTKKPDLLLQDDWLEASIMKNLKVSIVSQDNKEERFILNSKFLKKSGNYLIYLHNITHELEYESELIKLIYTDSITKLPNRSKLIDQLQNNLLNISSLAIFDVNSFKEINDFYGNKTGDTILFELGQLMTSITKESPALTLYKFPSDIYCLANTSLEKEEFIIIVRQIIDQIDKKIFIFEQSEINTRVTVGISFSEKNNKLITADLALQSAKNTNKDYLIFYEELDNIQEYENNMLWTKKVKYALENDNIIVYYQPLINNKTMKIEKYECLVRLKDEEKIISPFFFLDISKKSNQYNKITKVVIEKSCKAFVNLPYEFSVNISYEDIVDVNFFSFIESVLSKYKVSNQIVFEILEDENVKNYDVLVSFIEKVKKLGCKVAIDDFGSGYSNFEHLLKMNVDYLKIDASLIKNVAVDENSYKITKTIIEFANSLNLKTIAEFVENKEIFDIVSKLDADYSQGYYFAAPLAKPNFDIEAHNE